MKYRRSRPEVLCKKGVLKHFAQSLKEKTCTGISFLIKLQASSLKLNLKRDSSTVFSVNLSATLNLCKQLLLKIVKKIISFGELFSGFSVISFTFFVNKVVYYDFIYKIRYVRENRGQNNT